MSVYGLISQPGQAAYSASKFAVRGFSNCLRHELVGPNVGVTVAHPRGASTRDLKERTGSQGHLRLGSRAQATSGGAHARMPPSRAAEIITAGIACNKARGASLDAMSWWQLSSKG